MLELNYEEHLNNMAVDDNGVRHNGAAEVVPCLTEAKVQSSTFLNTVKRGGIV